MQSRALLLQRLNQTVDRILDYFQAMPDTDVRVYDMWSAKDVLAHITFWHESFARNVEDAANDRKPRPLKGRYSDLNQGGVDAMCHDTLEIVMQRLRNAQQIIQTHILNPKLVLIPYKYGARDYSPEEHLDIVDAHINAHFDDVRKHAGQIGP